MTAISTPPKKSAKRRFGMPMSDGDDEESKYRPIEWSLVRRILAELKPYKKQYALAYGIGMVHLFLEMQGPRFIGAITNHINDFVNARPPLPLHPAIMKLVEIVALWVTVFTISVICQRLLIIFCTRAGENVQFDTREKLFRHLQKLSMSYYDRTKLGRIISRMTSDINSLREINVWGIWHILANSFAILMAAGMIAWTDYRLFLAVAPLGIALFIINRYFVAKMGVLNQVTREGFTRVSSNLAENITGMRVVAAFNRQSPNLSTFNALQDDNTFNNVYKAKWNGVFQPLLSIIGFCGKAIILLYGGYLVATDVSGTYKIGSVVAAFLYWDWFMGPILFLGNFYNTVMAAMAGAERVFSLLDLKPDVVDTADAKPLPPIVGRVEFQDVTFSYVADRPVLHNINLVAEPGQVVALVGHTGCGKSTIVSLIARFYQPQQGRVLVDGHDIRFLTGDSLHKQMGLVLQSNYLFSGTVLDNIRYAKSDATDAEIKQAAIDLGTLEAIESLKDGFLTDVGERGGNMSLGQRQLICFTRAFLANPRIFMLDEATSAVDTHTEQIIQSSLERLTQGRTTFIVAHRLSTIMKADQILVIDAGKIIERGTHDQLLAADGKYAHLYQQFVMQTDE